MAKMEFVGALVQGVDHLISQLKDVDRRIALDLLDATYSEYPRPPWNTGQLRSSGAAYIGTTKVGTTPETGPNPNGPARTREKGSGGLSTGSSTFTPTFFGNTAKHLATANLGEPPNTVRGKITIIYHSPVAALMHEWDGGFSDSQSGPGYITQKLYKLDTTMYKHLGDVFRRYK